MLERIILKLSKKYKRQKQLSNVGAKVVNEPVYIEAVQKSALEIEKTPYRFDIINFLLQKINKQHSLYLEIGVRNPYENFDKIEAVQKYSVDPGLENKENPVDFKLTSDAFFAALDAGEILSTAIKFDVIFIDGLHLADQVERDIDNALRYIDDNGFIVLHDCNPPTEFHARESYYYRNSPAGGLWNGTTWKAFYKARLNTSLFSCCVDTDWGVGIISKAKNIGTHSSVHNPFFEYHVFETHRKESLNLISFEELQQRFNN
ncbi:class I SAM-dependent methyltransferase [Flavobacterium sp. SUN046]|uniref:class I SAM-dependent methyltransferase n=1 Tax=Flavobacterium sp. SUN046 TaxID=3002440 RepID=UPI002DB81E69|nr:class I SAM-dependent methyltransferase [Flavobacterium sp. SUN046]MEC4050901.1 class I SAM-dependent methyltransferase [Flavobacterium sp. SUN046]